MTQQNNLMVWAMRLLLDLAADLAAVVFLSMTVAGIAVIAAWLTFYGLCHLMCWVLWL